jgi:hypothetical protein
MVTVPRLQGQSFTPGVQPPVAAPPAGPLAAFGGGREVAQTFEAARGLALDAQQLLLQEQAKGDQIAVQEAETAASRLETDILHDPQTGILNVMLGKQALGAPDEMGRRWEEGTRAIEGNLTNNRQRLAFRQLASTRQANLGRQTTRHAAAELRKHDGQETQAYLVNEDEGATKNYENPERILLAIARKKDAIRLHGLRNGIPQEEVERLTADEVSKTHSLIIQTMLAENNDLFAMKYFQENKDDMTTQDRNRMGPGLAVGSIRGESQRFADRMVEQGMTREAALVEARKETNAKLRDAKVARIDARFNEIKRASVEQQEQNYLALKQQVIDAPRGVDVETFLDPGRVGQLTLNELNTLKKWNAPVHNPIQFNRFLAFSVERQAELAAMDERELDVKWLQHFGDIERKQAASIWKNTKEAVLRGSAESRKALLKLFQPNEIAKVELIRAGVLPGFTEEFDEEDHEKLTRFRELVESATNDWQAANPTKVPSNDLVRGLAKNILATELTLEEGDRGFAERGLLKGFRKIPLPFLSKQRHKIRRLLLEAAEIKKFGVGFNFFTRDAAERLYGAEILDDLELYESVLQSLRKKE